MWSGGCEDSEAGESEGEGAVDGNPAKVPLPSADHLSVRPRGLAAAQSRSKTLIPATISSST